MRFGTSICGVFGVAMFVGNIGSFLGTYLGRTFVSYPTVFVLMLICCVVLCLRFFFLLFVFLVCFIVHMFFVCFCLFVCYCCVFFSQSSPL